MDRSAARRSFRGPARLRSIAVGTILLASCATVPVGEGSTERTVAFTTYTVPAPEGDGWEVTRDPAKEDVSFQRKKSTLLGEPVASSLVKVLKVPFGEEAAAMSEEALANGFLEREHRGMLELGVARNLYRLGEVRKAVETIGGRKLYTMRYTTETPGPRVVKSEAGLFLYVPADYAARRAFYAFLVQESWATGSLVGSMASRDLGRIEPVIAGFTLHAAAPAEPRPALAAAAGPPSAKRLACPDVGGGAGGASGAGRVPRWGMTVDEVVAAFPGEAVRASPAEIEKGKDPVRLDGCELAGTSFQAWFRFREGRLDRIMLDPSSKRDAGRPLFERLARTLTERYGPPTDHHDDVKLLGPLRQSDRSWQTAGARVALVFMDGTDEPYLHLVYELPARSGADKK